MRLRTRRPAGGRCKFHELQEHEDQISYGAGIMPEEDKNGVNFYPGWNFRLRDLTVDTYRHYQDAIDELDLLNDSYKDAETVSKPFFVVAKLKWRDEYAVVAIEFENPNDGGDNDSKAGIVPPIKRGRN